MHQGGIGSAASKHESWAGVNTPSMKSVEDDVLVAMIHRHRNHGVRPRSAPDPAGDLVCRLCTEPVAVACELDPPAGK